MDSYVLLDIRGLVLRSLHAGTDRDAVTDSLTGRPVNTAGHAIERLVNDYLVPAFRTHRAKQIIAVWDGGNAYREVFYPEYKAHRKKREQSPELKAAIEETIKAAKLLLRYLGVVQVVVPSVEADDTIAWLAGKLQACLIHSVDRDLIQLCQGRVATCIGHQWVESLTEGDIEIPAHRVALYKSLVGDTSDGYKGVPGFGPAKWKQLVEQYGDDGLQELQNMLDTDGFGLLQQLAESGSEPLLAMLYSSLRDWRVSWELARLHPELINQKTTVKTSGKGTTLYLTPKWSAGFPQTDKLAALLQNLGSAHLGPTLAPFVAGKPFILDATLVQDEEEVLAELAQAFAESPFVSIDWETSAPVNEAFTQAARGREVVDMLSSRITGAGFTFGKHLEHTFYASFDHADTANLPIEFLPRLIDAIPDHLPKVAQNFLFERTVYKNQFGRELTNLHDTKVMGSHVNEQEPNGLKDMSLRVLGYKQLHYGDVIEKGKAMRDYSAAHVLEYGADDPLTTAHLYDFFRLQMRLEGTWEFCRDNEFPPIYLLSDAYLAGVNIDWQELERLRAEDQKIYDTSMARLRELIKTHQTPEWLRAGVENLLAIERELIDAKFAKAVKAGELTEQEANEKVADAVATLAAKIEDRVRYADYQTVDTPIDFTLTPAKLSALFQALGLPPIKDTNLGTLTTWASDCMALQPVGLAGRVVELVAEDYRSIRAKADTESTRRLVQIGQQILAESAPPEKRTKNVGSELSLSSPRQMLALLHGMLCLPLRIRNFDVNEERESLDLEGAPQANEDAILTAMAMDAPEGTWQREALECILAAKKADTRRKNFYTTYPLWGRSVDGKVHPQINSCGTETRRMSGNSPNLMQLPKRGDGIKFRNVILPCDGHDLIVSIDWAGEELRVGAGLSRDVEMLSCYIDRNVLESLPDWMTRQLGPGYVERFKNSELRDIHSLTAAGIAGLPYDTFEAIRHDETHPDAKRMKKIRGDAKGVNFLSQYGGGPTKLARKLICDPETAKDYLKAKKELYAGYEAWRAATIEQLHRQGYLATLYGSRRHLFDKLLTADEGMRGYLERSALNSLIQGLCADYLKVVLTQLWQRQTFQRHDAMFLAPIHDELVFSCHSSQAVSLILEVHKVMTMGIPGLPCPLWAEPSLGPNFGTQYEIGPHPTESAIHNAIGKAIAHQEAA